MGNVSLIATDPHPDGKPRLLLLRRLAPADRALLGERLEPHVHILEPAEWTEAALVALAASADAMLGAEVAPAILAAAPRLRLVQTPGAGLERLDLPALAARGIAVCNSHSHAAMVAEHGLTLLLALMRKVALHDRLMRNGTWWRPSGSPDDRLYQTDSLTGATIGLVGYGAINQSFARLVSGFGVELLIHTRRPRPEMISVPLDEMARQATAMVVAVPQTAETEGLIGEAVLAAAHPGLYLVNLGRAEVIPRAPLLTALGEKRIAGAALDLPYGGVDAWEGLADFTMLDNVVLSPHRAGTVRGQSPHMTDVAANLLHWAKTGGFRNRVDLEMGY